MKPGSGPWARVPAWLGGKLCGDHVATEHEAWVDLLGSWHQGEDVSAVRFMARCRWGKGRTLAFMAKVASWARDNGAAYPERFTSGPEADLRADRKRTDASEVQPEQFADSGPVADRNRTASCARDLLLVQKRGEEMVDLAPPVPVVAPPLDLPSVLKGDTTLTAPLTAAGITTLDALTAQTPTAVQMLHGVGPKRLAAIVAHLAEAGLTLRPEPAKARKADIDRPGLRDFTDRWAGAYEHVTGRPYVWTPGGRRSDNKAARELYDALGWSAEPSEATVQRVRGVVIRYLRTRTTPGSHRVPTLADLAACLDQFAQDDHVVASAHKPRPVQVTKADQEREMLGGLQALFTERSHVVADS